MPELSKQQIAKLDALKDLPDDKIDTSDIPDRPYDSSKAIRGAFYQPVKRSVNLQLDEYVVQWFKENADPKEDYQGHINQVLMEHIQRQRIAARRAAAETATAESRN